MFVCRVHFGMYPWCADSWDAPCPLGAGSPGWVAVSFGTVARHLGVPCQGGSTRGGRGQAAWSSRSLHRKEAQKGMKRRTEGAMQPRASQRDTDPCEDDPEGSWPHSYWAPAGARWGAQGCGTPGRSASATPPSRPCWPAEASGAWWWARGPR